MNIKELKDYVLFDTETNGLDPRASKILEYGCIRVRNDEMVENYRVIANQKVIIPFEASAIHGITNDVMYKEGIDPKEAVTGCINFIGDDVVIGLNNVSFDYPFLEVESNLFGLPRPKIDKWFDIGMWHKGIQIGQLWNREELFYKYAMRIRDIKAKGVKYNLDYLCKTYECENLREDGKHGAIKDLKMTHFVFQKMRAKYG